MVTPIDWKLKLILNMIVYAKEESPILGDAY